MNLNRLTKKQSGLVIAMIYLITMTLGIIVYFLGVGILFHPILVMLLVDIFMTLVIFFIGLKLKNASLYDPYWSVIPPFIILLWMIVYGGSFRSTSTLLVFIAIALWSIRLTYNWWKNWQGFDKQDWRYDMLKEKNSKIYFLTNLFGIHMFPTLIVYLQLVSVYTITLQSQINIIFIIGFILSIIAPTIQFIADKQVYDFRQKNPNKDLIINTGLWRYSRHPNYFGELLFWVGIYIMYLGTVGKIDLNILFPIAMILLFVFISVPMMEKKLIHRPGYSEYRKSVPMIVPFFTKNRS